MRNQFLLGAALTALMVPVAVSAQETTSTIAGQVTDNAGKPVANARITVVHTPSGTRSVTTTDGGGFYNLRGLRVGGPYTVTAESAGLPTERVEGLSLTIGDSFNLPLQFQQKDIVVTATKAKGSAELSAGSESSFKRTDIAGVVSARRDVRDIVRRDLLSSFNPTTGGVSIAGGVVRTQRFSIDGVQLQDNFGLNYGGLPSSRGIVSIEAIDQLTVKAAPFDISEGNFQGGAVNVVLKSGTNRLHFSAFGDWGGPTLTGKQTAQVLDILGNKYAVSNTKIQNFKNYGGSISGPIIPGKLFFAASYEKLNEGTPNPFGIAGTGAPNIVPTLNTTDTSIAAGQTLPGTTTPFGYSNGAFTLAGTNTISSIYNTVYAPTSNKFDIGTIPVSISENDEKYSGKIDWNITSGQRLSATYIHHVNTIPSYVGGSASVQSPNLNYLSYDYQLTEHTDAESVQLNSKWTSRFSTELRASYRYYRRGQDSYNGTNFAAFQICTDPTSVNSVTSCSTGSPTTNFGPDAPRQANLFNSHALTLQANANYTTNGHTIKAEVDHYNSKLYNLFVFPGGAGPQGLYYFDSIADYQGRTASELKYGNSTTGVKTDGYVDWAYSINTAGLQDTWKVQPNLTVDVGLRYDRYTADNSIATNPYFVARYGFSNNATLDGRDKLQPRLGFNWQPANHVKLLGGIGLFSGGFSDVFVSNNYSNSGAAINTTGAILNNADLQRSTLNADGCIDAANSIRNFDPGAAVCAALKNVDGVTQNKALQNYIATNLSSLSSALTNSLDPRFKLPAQWKYNLSITANPDLSQFGLGRGWNFRADVLFSDTQQAPRWIDLRAQPLVIGGVVQYAPDGRPRYNNSVGNNYDIQLTNTTKGQSRVYAVGVQKDFDFGVTLSASYTHQNVKDVAGIYASSTVGSAYGSIATNDPNSGGAYGRSFFEVTNQARFGFDFHHKFFGDNETRLGINAELRSGNPYSLTFLDFANGSTSSGNRVPIFGTAQNNGEYLFYVPNFNLTPTNNGLTYGVVTFADQGTLTSIQNLVNARNLAKYAGTIIPKNSETGPSYQKVDLHFSQQVPFFHHSHFTALFDIENVLNLIDSQWGTFQSFGDQTVVRVTCNTGGATPVAISAATTNSTPCGGYTYSTANINSKATAQPKFSLYAIRLGVRFDF
jgi:hypothetical protein